MATANWANPGISGNWSTNANWTGGSGTGGSPGATDDVLIVGDAGNTGYTVTLDITTTPALDSVSLATGAGDAVTLALGANTLDVTGGGSDTVTLNDMGGATISLAGGTIDATDLNLATANALVTGSGTLSITTSVIGSGTITASGGTLILTGAGTLTNAVGYGISDAASLFIADVLPSGATFTFAPASTSADLTINNITSSVGETVVNMNVATTLTPTDKIDFSGATVSVTGGGSGTGSSGTVTVTQGANTITLNLTGLANTGTNWFADTAPDGGSGTALFFSNIACYGRGTRILTEDGEVPVEDLKIGDALVTFSGAVRPIRWIGTRVYDGRFVAGNRMVLPIRVAAGALAEGVPARELFVSPMHSLYFDHVLVPAEQLVNGVTIAQVQAVDRVEYFHIELDSHDVIIAEGAPAETFVDCDNRGMFQNSADYALLYPDDERPHWEFCAPRLEQDSLELTAIRARLWERAIALVPGLETDPNLHLVADGKTIWPDSASDCLYRFTVPAGSAAVALGSQSLVPAEVTSGSHDIRRLGVPVERIALSDGDLSIEAAHGHEALSDGFHGDEDTHRWTDGLALLPKSWLGLFAGEFTLEVRLAPGRLDYRVAAIASARDAA